MRPDKKTKEIFKLLSCVIYTIISNYVCIDYLGFESKTFSELGLGSDGRFKRVNKNHDKTSNSLTDMEFQFPICCHNFCLRV